MSGRLRAALCALLLPTAAAAQSTGWFADKRTGCKLWYPSAHASLTVRWTGPCVNGLAHGSGTFEFLESDGKSAAKGEIEFRNGKREGMGFVVRHDGVRVEAEYRNGVATGKAVEVFPSGDRYVGGYLDGEKSGYGVYVWANGDRYEGQWLNDKRSGKGILKAANGDRYEGEWKSDKRDGRGTYTWGDGDRYVGEYRAGRPHGQGSYDTRDRSGRPVTLAGEWRDGCFNNGRYTKAISTTTKACGFD